jgi:hypothetical protein
MSLWNGLERGGAVVVSAYKQEENEEKTFITRTYTVTWPYKLSYNFLPSIRFHHFAAIVITFEIPKTGRLSTSLITFSVLECTSNEQMTARCWKFCSAVSVTSVPVWTPQLKQMYLERWLPWTQWHCPSHVARVRHCRVTDPGPGTAVSRCERSNSNECTSTSDRLWWLSPVS